jgi:hypothetical protein
LSCGETSNSLAVYCNISFDFAVLLRKSFYFGVSIARLISRNPLPLEIIAIALFNFKKLHA